MAAFTDWASAVSGIATMVSGMAATASVIVAWLTVRDARAGRREERRSVRPYFSVASYKAWDRADGKHGIRVKLLNSGEHPAAIEGTVKLTEPRYRREPLFTEQIATSQVLPGRDVEWEMGEVEFEPDLPPHLIIFRLRYDDLFTGESFDQPLALRWEGVSSGRASERFCILTKDELKNLGQTQRALCRLDKGA